jgi:hypothetical protein
MNIRQSSIKNALLSFGLLLFAGTLSLAVSTSVSARPDKNIPLPDIPFSLCPPPDQLDPSIFIFKLIPTRVQLTEQRDEFGSGSQQKLFISVTNVGWGSFSPPKNNLIEVTVNGTLYTGLVYGSAAAQYQLGGAIARCETGGISLNATFPIGTFQKGQQVKVGISNNGYTTEVTLTIQ